ncbi:HPr kinase/phosphorylase [Sphingomonas sp. TZW2008]|uniref:HPr kinase/phosphorylase n=1 Tax=Sphingomonas sp. TZW2008 TaxID=1917973 RepID=UPI000A2703B8|nr:HPr kinase/phosphatase C-terminal domain-containing protein [Sphingomonas sp. TZW2008]
MTGVDVPLRETIHASTVAIGGRAVLIRGASGSGKSDLALRLIDRGAQLVSDDYTVIEARDGQLVASAPATIAGRIEVRGLGIVPCPPADPAVVALAVRVDAPPQRMPEPEQDIIGGIAVPSLALDPRPASAPLLVELALKHRLP